MGTCGMGLMARCIAQMSRAGSKAAYALPTLPLGSLSPARFLTWARSVSCIRARGALIWIMKTAEGESALPRRCA